MDVNFWKGRRVFLTGHTGFKGSWLSLWLAKSGAQVTGYALEPPTNPSLFELANVADTLDSKIGNILDTKSLEAAMAEADPDVLLHLAAQPIVRESYETPVETFSTNVIGTANVLQAARQSDRLRAIVVVTSDKCYENREWHWGYREDEAMGGSDPYSASKGCTELVAQSFARSFFSPDNPSHSKATIATGRAGNVIGGGDYATDRLITDIVASINKGEPVQIRNPNSIRPWQHVLEPLHGYLMLAEHVYAHGDEFSGGWNFGPSDTDAKPVSWICDQLTKRWGPDASWAFDDGDHPHEAKYLKLDSSKARNLLGWQPRLDLDTALEWIIEWFHAAKDAAETGGDMRASTIAQIERYENKG